MSTNVTFTDPHWWVGEEERDNPTFSSVRWGYTSYGSMYGKPVVTRLSFKVPSSGAGHYVLNLNRIGRIDKSEYKSTKRQIGYHIGRDPKECIGWYGESATSDSEFVRTGTSDYNTFTAEGDFMMRPEETLYLWLFHCGSINKSQAHYKIQNSSDEMLYIELSGEGGGVSHAVIDGEEKVLIPYIFHDDKWQPAVPYVYHDDRFIVTS